MSGNGICWLATRQTREMNTKSVIKDAKRKEKWTNDGGYENRGRNRIRFGERCQYEFILIYPALTRGREQRHARCNQSMCLPNLFFVNFSNGHIDVARVINHRRLDSCASDKCESIQRQSITRMKSTGNNIYFSIRSKLNTQRHEARTRIDNTVCAIEIYWNFAPNRDLIKFVFVCHPFRAVRRIIRYFLPTFPPHTPQRHIAARNVFFGRFRLLLDAGDCEKWKIHVLINRSAWVFPIRYSTHKIPFDIHSTQPWPTPIFQLAIYALFIFSCEHLLFDAISSFKRFDAPCNRLSNHKSNTKWYWVHNGLRDTQSQRPYAIVQIHLGFCIILILFFKWIEYNSRNHITEIQTFSSLEVLLFQVARQKCVEFV